MSQQTIQAFIEKRFSVDRTHQPTTPRITWSQTRIGGKPDADVYSGAAWVIHVHSQPYVQISLKDAERVTAADGQGLLAVIAECEAQGIKYNTYYDGDFVQLARRWQGTVQQPSPEPSPTLRPIAGTPTGASIPPFPR